MELKNSMNENKDHSVTVVIPFRNEMEHLPMLLLALLKNKPVNAEILFVDDHSDDGAAEWIKEQYDRGNCRYIRLKEHWGKKAAITEGVFKANGSWIQILDADCLPFDTYWKEVFKAAGSADLLAGGVVFEGDRFWGAYQVLENSSLVVFGAVDMVQQKPTMANGGNMGFLKSHFLEVGGYAGNQHLAGGDDIFLIEKFKRAGFSIGFHFNKEAWVKTAVKKNIASFISQRKRWLHKVRFQKSKWAFITQGAVSLLFLAVISILLLHWKWGVILFLIKGIFDGIFFYLLDTYFHLRRPIKWLMAVEVIQMVFVPWLVLTSAWYSYDWKGRIYLPKTDQIQK